VGFHWFWRRYFTKIILSALPVGHSHSDYDREGAALIHFTKRSPGEGSLSPADLLRKLNFMTHACGRDVKDAYDFQTWLAPHIDSKLHHHTKALQWRFTLRPSDGKCVASYAGDCSVGATIKEFGPILKSSPASVGPSTCPRWGGSAAAKTAWEAEVKKNIGLIGAMEPHHLAAYGYTGGTARADATDEWRVYETEGKAAAAALLWPPPVLAEAAAIGFKGQAQPRLQPVARDSLAPPPAEIQPLPTAGGPAAAPPVFTAGGWQGAVAGLATPPKITQGKLYLVLADDAPKLWLAKVTSGKGLGAVAMLAAAGGAAHGEAAALEAAASRNAHPGSVRVRWFACPDVESSEWQSLQCTASAGPTTMPPFADATHQPVHSSSGLGWVDARQVGPRLELYGNGKLKPESKRILVAAAMSLKTNNRL
jgi:hypothetical protein